jgi:hypothetical protein
LAASDGGAGGGGFKCHARIRYGDDLVALEEGEHGPLAPPVAALEWDRHAAASRR